MSNVERFEFSKTKLIALQNPAPKPGKDGAPATATRRVVYDSKVTKLALRVASSGSKTFYVVRRTDGAMEWIKLDPFPQMTVEQARKRAEEVLGAFAGGRNPAEAKRAIRGEWSFTEAFEFFIKYKRNKRGLPISDNTQRDYQDVYRIHLAPIHSVKLSKISRDRVRSLHTAITPKSSYQADKALAIICAVFNFAKDREHFHGENPASRIQKNPTVDRSRFAQKHELPHLFWAIEQSSLRDFFWLALLTGVRRANLEAMQWRDLDLDGQVWHLKMTKNGDPQDVPLVAEAIEILKNKKAAAARGDLFVFQSDSKAGHLVEPKTSWKRILRLASLSQLLEELCNVEVITPTERDEALRLSLTVIHLVEKKYYDIAQSAKIKPENYLVADLRIHDLRRTFGSYQAMTNSSRLIIGKSLGHKTERATLIYARMNIDPVRSSMSAGTSEMLAAAGLKDSAEVISIKKNQAA